MRVLGTSAKLALILSLAGCAGGNIQPPSSPGKSPTQHVFDGNCDLMGAPFGGGDGSATSPFLICTVAQLNAMSDPAHESASFLLVDNLDANNGPLQQIPNLTGVLDGNNKSISNWTGDGPLISTLSGTVKNLNVVNATITGAWRASMIAGTVTTTGTITNSSVSGSISASYMSAGIAGVNAGHVTGCSANVTVTGTDHLAGLVATNNGTITSCTSSGTVTGSTARLNMGTDGGLVAWNDGGTITLSSSSANVSGQNGVGGLVGTNHSGIISQCSASGSVRGNDGAGGLVGVSFENATISNSYALGTVLAQSGAGGFIGYNGGSVTNSFSAGSVSGGASTGGFAGGASYVYQPDGNPPPPTITYTGTSSQCHWDTSTSGQASSAVGTGHTTLAMQSAATFAGWNFTTIWLPPSGGYPKLR